MTVMALREFHPFRAAGKTFLYLVPSAAVFQLDPSAEAVIDALREGPRSVDDLQTTLATRFSAPQVQESLVELREIRAIGEAAPPAAPPPCRTEAPVRPRSIPLATLVLNVTSKCNLSCKYCYEYGEDKLVDQARTPMPPFMSEDTARQSVEFMLKESGESKVAHLTFFGGETLLNFKVLKSTVAYARARGAELGKAVDFSLTTNATLLKPDTIEWLAENDIGVTISIDGPKKEQDGFRTFKNGKGSYDLIVPRIKDLLQRHRSRPIGARVTLTRQNLDVQTIFRHLIDEIGFWEVGFAPVTTASNRDWSISDGGYDHMLAQFTALAEEFLAHALQHRHHGFSNVRDTLEEIHKGQAKAYPCGAGLGLLGVATDGGVALCHRFAGSEQHEIGSVFDGVDRERQNRFLDEHHIANKTDCRTCWARPICAGGCYHEAQTRYGTTAAPNLHYCTWVRTWTDTCLRIYGEIAERNPAFLQTLEH